MANKEGRMDYSEGSGIVFFIASRRDDDAACHLLEWQNTPAEMAKALREAAKFLEEHSSEYIVANID